MSDMEKKNRVELEDLDLEDVTGGNVLFVCTATEYYCYGAHNPDVKYEFFSARQCQKFIRDHYDYYGEAGIFQAMMNEGLIIPM